MARRGCATAPVAIAPAAVIMIRAGAVRGYSAGLAVAAAAAVTAAAALGLDDRAVPLTVACAGASEEKYCILHDAIVRAEASMASAEVGRVRAGQMVDVLESTHSACPARSLAYGNSAARGMERKGKERLDCSTTAPWAPCVERFSLFVPHAVKPMSVCVDKLGRRDEGGGCPCCS